MTDGVRIEPDVAYGAAGRDLLCDVYLPAPAAARGAATILLHGGGWRGGSRAMMKDAAALLAGRGYLAVAAEYRLTGEAPWPAQIHDVKTVIRWLRANAGRFGVHPEMITLVGFSAGGHLALLAAGTADTGTLRGDGSHAGVSERVAAVTAFFSPVRLLPGALRPSGLLPGDEAAASPITYARADFPPTLLLHGTGDPMVSHTESVRLFDALAAAGAPVDLRLYAGLPHEFQRLPGYLDLCVADIDCFIDRHVVSRAQFDARLTDERAVWEERARSVRVVAG
jgi:acetyl esterase/lipase